MTSPQDPTQPWLSDPNQGVPSDPTAYSDPPGYPSQSGYPTQPGYPPTAGFGQPPGYAPQPGYVPQPGLAAPGYGYPMYAPTPPMNTMAIIALVLAFVFAPAAIVCGHIARKQIRSTGESGDGLALAGLIVGYIFTAVLVLICGFYAVFAVAIFHTVNTTDPTNFLHLF